MMKNPAAFVELRGMIPKHVPYGAIGVVEEVNEEEETAFVVFEQHDIALDLPLYCLIFIDPCKKQSVRH